MNACVTARIVHARTTTCSDVFDYLFFAGMTLIKMRMCTPHSFDFVDSPATIPMSPISHALHAQTQLKRAVSSLNHGTALAGEPLADGSG